MPEFLIPIRPPREGRKGVRKRLEKAFEEIRDVDRLGRAAIVRHDEALDALVERWPEEDPPEADPVELWEEIKARFQELAARGPCLRCGTCCRTSSPTLYAGDLELIEGGWIPRSALYTLRKGERVYTPRLKEAAPVETDLVKVRESADGLCFFLADSLCRVHGHHPLQCRYLECWTGKHAGDLSKEPRLDRRALYASDETALALIAEYDAKVPAEVLALALEGAAAGDEEAVLRALELVDLDDRLRAGIAARFGYGRDEQALLLGREALLVARAHGLLPCLKAGAPWLAPAPAAADAAEGGD